MSTLLASTPTTMTDKIFGTFLFLAFIAFIVLTFLDAFGTVRRWLDKKRPTEPGGVNLTLNQVYSSDREYFEVTAAEMIRRHNEKH